VFGVSLLEQHNHSACRVARRIASSPEAYALIHPTFRQKHLPKNNTHQGKGCASVESNNGLIFNSTSRLLMLSKATKPFLLHATLTCTIDYNHPIPERSSCRRHTLRHVSHISSASTRKDSKPNSPHLRTPQEPHSH
jgi:hypothetical protein